MEGSGWADVDHDIAVSLHAFAGRIVTCYQAFSEPGAAATWRANEYEVCTLERQEPPSLHMDTLYAGFMLTVHDAGVDLPERFQIATRSIMDLSASEAVIFSGAQKRIAYGRLRRLLLAAGVSEPIDEVPTSPSEAEARTLQELETTLLVGSQNVREILVPRMVGVTMEASDLGTDVTARLASVLGRTYGVSKERIPEVIASLCARIVSERAKNNDREST